MSRAIVPIADLTRRIPEAGRIRTGKKTGNRPTAIGEFRFTSHDRTALEQIAALYGGTVNPWSDPKAADGQYEVITDAPEIGCWWRAPGRCPVVLWRRSASTEVEAVPA